MTSERPAHSTRADPSGEAQSANETDFYAWTQEQAAALQNASVAGLDVANLIEEIDALGRAQINALGSRYLQLCVHLLKLAHQPQKSSRSWLASISHQRIEIARLFEDSLSLKSKRAALFTRAYNDARRQASVETGLAVNSFPAEPVFTIDQAESDDWFPDRKKV